jgi:hypothetical protein
MKQMTKTHERARIEDLLPPRVFSIVCSCPEHTRCRPHHRVFSALRVHCHETGPPIEGVTQCREGRFLSSWSGPLIEWLFATESLTECGKRVIEYLFLPKRTEKHTK